MQQAAPKPPDQVRNDPTDSRWQVLAGLRFLLALVVVAGHLNWFVKPAQPWTFLESMGGTAAVIGFLIISGYSIGHSLQRRPVGFYRRRVLRIYPLYATAVLFAWVPFWSGADAFAAPGDTFARPHLWVVVGNLLMLQNLLCLPVDSNMLLWTLGVEVICYLLAPLFRKTASPLLVLLIAISAASYALFPRMGLAHYATLKFGLPLLLFIWAWLCGFILQRMQNSIWMGLSIAGLCAALTLTNRIYNTPLFLPTAIASALLVTLSPRIPIPRSVAPVMNYLGDLSYPMYLFHLPTLLLGYGIFNLTQPWGLLAMILSISAAFLFIESIIRRAMGPQKRG